MINKNDLINLIAEITRRPVESIEMQNSFRGDLGMDSMQALELLVVLEEDFSVIVPQERAATLKTVEQLWAFIQNAPMAPEISI